MSSKFDHPMPNDLESIKDILEKNNYKNWALYDYSFLIYLKAASPKITIRKEKNELFLNGKNISGHSISDFLDEVNKLDINRPN
jgi:hypothetical protein